VKVADASSPPLDSLAHFDLPQHDFPKSKRTSCTMYGSSRFTYHHGTRSCFVNEHVSAEKNDEVEPSMAFCGMPAPSVEICIGALPAATLRTVKKERKLFF
jgi:hypothetical protein